MQQQTHLTSNKIPRQPKKYGNRSCFARLKKNFILKCLTTTGVPEMSFGWCPRLIRTQKGRKINFLYPLPTIDKNPAHRFNISQTETDRDQKDKDIDYSALRLHLVFPSTESRWLVSKTLLQAQFAIGRKRHLVITLWFYLSSSHSPWNMGWVFWKIGLDT